MITDDDFALALQLQAEFDREDVELLPFGGVISNGFPKVEPDLLSDRPIRPPEKPKSSLIDSSLELIDPTPDARALFIEFNDKYFWGKLASVEVKWSSRMTLCAGLCVYEGRGGMCSIRLSEPLLKLRPRKDLIETLLHEMIHAYLFLTDNNRDRDGHGPEFQSHMHRLNKATGSNITIYHSFHNEVNSYHTHWWRCNGSCQNRKPFYGYVKRSMNRAPSSRDPWWSEHQRHCSGTFIKVREPEDYGAKKNKVLQKPKLAEPSDSKNNLTQWLQSTSPEKRNITKPGLTGSNMQTSSDINILDVDIISDDELMSAVNGMENKLTHPVQSADSDNDIICLDNEDYWSKIGTASLVSTKDHNQRHLSENTVPPCGAMKFPGNGFRLCDSSLPKLPNLSSAGGPIVRRLPGIGVIEVQTNKSNVTTINTGSSSRAVEDKMEWESKDFRNNNRNDSCKATPPTMLKSNGGEQMGTISSQKVKTDILLQLSDSSRRRGEVIKVPDFISVSNPNFRKHKAKIEMEKTKPVGKLRRTISDESINPAKKIRLNDDFVAVINNTNSYKNEIRGETDTVKNVNKGKTDNMDSDEMDVAESQTLASVLGRMKSLEFQQKQLQDHKGDASEEIPNIGPKKEETAGTSFSNIRTRMPENPPIQPMSVPGNYTLCPSCGISVTMNLINEHLDACLTFI